MDGTNATHTICSCDHLTNFALLMVQKQTPEVQFFAYMNENNHLQMNGGGASPFGQAAGSLIGAGFGENENGSQEGDDSDETDTNSNSSSNINNNNNSNNNFVEDLADFKKIILKNYERILSKHWDFLSSREVRELSPREQEEVFGAWKESNLVTEQTNLDKRKSIDLIRNEFLRLKNFSKMRKMLVLIKNSLFWKMKFYNNTSPRQMTGKINWKDLPRSGLVKNFLRNLIKFRDTLRDGKMDNEKAQLLDLVWTERQENAFIVRFIMLNGEYMRRFVNGSAEGKSKKSFRELNSFYTTEQLNYLSMLRQQRKEEKPDNKADVKLIEDLRALEKDEWFSLEDVREDEITDNGLDFGYGDDETSAEDNIFLFQLIKNNTSLRFFIYLSIVFCIAFIIIAIVLLKVYHGSMFKVRNSGDSPNSPDGGIVDVDGGGLGNMLQLREGGLSRGIRGVDVLQHHRHQHNHNHQAPIPLPGLSDLGRFESSRGNSLRRSLVRTPIDHLEDDNGDRAQEFEMKQMYNGGVVETSQQPMHKKSLKKKKKKKRKSVEWPTITGPGVIGGVGNHHQDDFRSDNRNETESERQLDSRDSDEDSTGFEGGRMILNPTIHPPIFVNQHHHHLHHHLHTHTHYGPQGVENAGMASVGGGGALKNKIDRVAGYPL